MRIDSREVVRILEEAADRIEAMDGVQDMDSDRGLDSKQRAEISKELLFIAHLCRKAETLVLDQYHVFKGYQDHVSTRRRERGSR